ncbi:hypothetical protein ACFPC0_32965 [Streptomyces andamanensis]|uniref:Uncharacterized protein n=1 Tax=Streptomyces andamanensis TaxID=1565035 RepID=A0ABV8TPK8_9ACTN
MSTTRAALRMTGVSGPEAPWLLESGRPGRPVYARRERAAVRPGRPGYGAEGA